MKCPVCGSQIEDEMMYCAKCGYEIQMVPDFEPVIENSIKKHMDDVVAGISGDDAINKSTDNHPSKKNTVKKYDFDTVEDENNSPSLVSTIVTCTLALVLVVIVIITVTNLLKGAENDPTKSYDALYAKAVEEANSGDYDSAINSLLSALRVESNHPDARFLMAEYEVKAGKIQDAENLYKDLFQVETYAQEAYEKYIELLESEGKENLICDALASCTIPEILHKYPQYVSEPPSYSLPEGSFDVEQQLQLFTSQTGIIYYTLDGTAPTTESAVYEEPILLDFGKFTVCSMFVNQYGRQSDVVTKVYIINTDLYFEPVVTPEGGSYDEQEMIHVEVPEGCNVFYTTDGTMPTQLSKRYTDDIPLPFGNTVFNFIAYNSYGKSSEVVKVEYHFTSIKGVSIKTDGAIAITMQGLVNKGLLSDVTGHRDGDNGVYSVEVQDVFKMNDKYYYYIAAYYTDPNGIKSDLIVRYAVNASDGTMYNAAIGNDGKYVISNF